VSAIAKRELKAYFYSPIGYVCVGVLSMLYGLYFYQVMMLRSSAYLSDVYGTMFIWSMMFIPIITMRCFSEEIKNRTDQALLTAPVGVTSIVAGKFFAAFLVFAIATLGSLIPVTVIAIFSSPSWPQILGNVVGSLLYGAAMIAIGVFISSLTQSQIVAAIGTFGVSILLLALDQAANVITNTAVQKLIGWLSFNSRYSPFTKGVFDLRASCFF